MIRRFKTNRAVSNLRKKHATIAEGWERLPRVRGGGTFE